MGGTTYNNTKSVIPEMILKDESEFGKWESIYRLKKEARKMWHKEVWQIENTLSFNVGDIYCIVIYIIWFIMYSRED